MLGRFTFGHPDLLSTEARQRAGRSCSRTKKGKPLSEKQRDALRPYWESKRGIPSLKRNGRYINCPVCMTPTYKNQRDLKRAKNLFCSQRCAYKFRDQGKTSANSRIRDSKEYVAWRLAVFTRDDYTCQACGQRGGKLNADHELPFALYPDLRFEVLNGRTLCVACHQKTDTYGGKPSPWKLAAVENPSIPA